MGERKRVREEDIILKSVAFVCKLIQKNHRKCITKKCIASRKAAFIAIIKKVKQTL